MEKSKYQVVLDELLKCFVEFYICGVEVPQGLIDNIHLYQALINRDILRQREVIADIKAREESLREREKRLKGEGK